MKQYVLFLLIAVSFAACTKVEEATVVPPVSAAKSPDPTPTSEEAIIALLRGHPHAKTVCAEPEFNGYYIQWAMLPDGTPDDGFTHGTFLVQKIKFYQSSNKTWFIVELTQDEYMQVWPDLTGLTCKTQ